MGTKRKWPSNVFKMRPVWTAQGQGTRSQGLRPVMLVAAFGSLLVACISPPAALSQSAPTESQTTPNGQKQVQPVPLPHLYWHFLIYLNYLDTRAAQLDAQGRNGNGLRSDLQNRLGFSDTDFAPIRASSQRLASELKPLNEQAKSIAATKPSAATAAQWKALTAQREAYINAEIASIRQALPQDKISSFEAFLTQFFAPKSIVAPARPPATHPMPRVQP